MMLLLTLAGSMFGSYYLNKGEIATLQGQVTTMNSQIPHLQDEVKNIQRMTDALQPQIEQIQKSLTELNLTRVTQSINDLSARVLSALSTASSSVEKANAAVEKAASASAFIRNLNFSMSELVAARMRSYMKTVSGAEQRIDSATRNITEFAQQLKLSLDTIRESVTNLTSREDRLETSLRASVTNLTSRADILEAVLRPVVAHVPGYVLVKAQTTQNLTIGSVIAFGQPLGGQAGYPATVSFDSDSGSVLLAAGEISVTFHLQMTLGASCSGTDVRFSYAWKNGNSTTIGVEGTSSAPLTPAIATCSLPPWGFQKFRLVVTTSPSPVCVCRVTGSLLVDEV